MFIFKRLVPIFATLLSLLVAELAIATDANPAGWVILAAALPLVYQLLLIPKRLFRSQFWGLGVPLWLFGLGSMCVLLYVPGAIWQQVAALGTSAFIGLYLETEFSFLFQSSKYVPFSMERMGEIVLAGGAGMTCMGMIGLDFIGLMRNSETLLMAAVWAVLISASAVYMYRLPKDKRWFLFLFGAAGTFQLYWVLQFLPISFVVSGAVAGIMVASLFSVLRYATLESLDKKTVWRTVTTSGTAVIILLMTTRWT